MALCLKFLLRVSKDLLRRKEEVVSLAPVFFSRKYKLFDQLLQTVEIGEDSSECSFQTFSTDILSTTDFNNPLAISIDLGSKAENSN